MSVTALFRGKFGHKSQVTQQTHLAAPVQLGHDEDEDDDSRGGFSRDPIRRNSRFYRSMRKKRLVSSEREAESKNPVMLLPSHVPRELRGRWSHRSGLATTRFDGADSYD